MLDFPPVLPDTSLRFGSAATTDHYVRVDTNDYSVNPRFVGRRVEVRVTLDEVVAELRRRPRWHVIAAAWPSTSRCSRPTTPV